MFDKAKQASPCVLFISELGSIETDRALSQLLTEIGWVESKTNLFIIGSTSRPEILDSALLKPWRLGQLLYIPLPDKLSRISILSSLERKFQIYVNAFKDLIVDLTDGFSGADLAELLQMAAKAALRETSVLRKGGDAGEVHMVIDAPASNVSWRHFEEALNNTRKSVSSGELCRHDKFRKEFDPAYARGIQGGLQGFKWPDLEGGKSASLPQGGDDDIYN